MTAVAVGQVEAATLSTMTAGEAVAAVLTNVPAAAVDLAIVQVVATDSLAGVAPASFEAAFAA